MDPTQRSITSSPRDHDAKKRLTILHFRKHLAPMKTMNHLPLDDTGIWLTRVNCDNNDSLYIRQPQLPAVPRLETVETWGELGCFQEIYVENGMKMAWTWDFCKLLSTYVLLILFIVTQIICGSWMIKDAHDPRLRTSVFCSSVGSSFQIGWT